MSLLRVSDQRERRISQHGAVKLGYREILHYYPFGDFAALVQNDMRKS
jgi:hypothetical protein